MRRFLAFFLCLLLCAAACADGVPEGEPEETPESHGRIILFDYGEYGGMINGHYSLTLEPDGDSSGAVLRLHGMEGRERQVRVGRQMPEDLGEYLERLKPETWEDFPEAEFFAYDAPVTSASVFYEDGECFTLSDTRQGTRDMLHDIRCFLESYLAENPETLEMTFRSFDGGGPSFRPVIRDPEMVAWDTRSEYGERDPLATGSPYTVVMTFRGRIPGTTEMYIEVYGPMAEPGGEQQPETYTLEIDEDYNIRLLPETD